MIWLSNLAAQIESLKISESNRIPIVRLPNQIFKVKLSNLSQKRPNRDLNSNRDWDLPITGHKALFISYTEDLSSVITQSESSELSVVRR